MFGRYAMRIIQNEITCIHVDVDYEMNEMGVQVF